MAHPQVSIRPWQRRDRRTIARWPAPQLPAHWSDIVPSSGPRLSYAIDLLGNLRDRLVGRITLRDFVDRSARIGIYLHPEYYNRGIGSEAIKQLFTYVSISNQFDDTIEIASIKLDVASDNERAVRCYKKVGFVVTAQHCRDGKLYLEMAKDVAPAGSLSGLAVSGLVHP